MVQRESGLESGCVCPFCLTHCRDCMGTDTPPLGAEELAPEARLRQRLRELENEED
ncbi:hypothetical protein LJC42_04885 [Eubacteriales bacterium OttesenSCG-928-K08]|nr:hypothetical protein [Eubacteriales bacterium OttesenSCG-928-K08]